MHPVISIHAPARGATFLLLPAALGITNISIHAPARGATYNFHHSLSSIYLFLSTLPQGERHRMLPGFSGGRRISIHAPARGATHVACGCSHPKVYFYPRSRKGSDFNSFFVTAAGDHFYPRSRKGSDCYGVFMDEGKWISIHAPARGATSRASGNRLRC